jgi:hypothetical protein
MTSRRSDRFSFDRNHHTTEISSKETAVSTEPQLSKKTFHSSLTGSERPYWRYLPRGYGDPDTRWPAILFLHGGGERGEDLDLVCKHGPLKEVVNGRELSFIILGPQMPSRPANASRGRRPPPWPAGKRKPMLRETAGAVHPWDRLGPPNGWHESEGDLLAMVDNTLAACHADPDRVYLTGL